MRRATTDFFSSTPITYLPTFSRLSPTEGRPASLPLFHAILHTILYAHAKSSGRERSDIHRVGTLQMAALGTQHSNEAIVVS